MPAATAEIGGRQNIGAISGGTQGQGWGAIAAVIES
jgi:hypothetical protein